MKKNQNLLRVFLACLPLLSETLPFKNAFFHGGWIAIAYWGTMLFFSLSRSCLPKWAWETSFVLWALAAAQGLWYVANINIYWVVSLLILIPLKEFRKNQAVFPKEHVSVIFRRGLGFWILVVYLGLSQEILGRYLHFELFQQPAGSFLLLAVSALVFPWKKGVVLK